MDAGKTRKRKGKEIALNQARSTFDKARTDLATARRQNDHGKIAKASSAMDAAGAAIDAAQQGRFERIASMRGTTALAAIEHLIKLVNQRRYPITGAHAASLTVPIRESLDILENALRAAVDRGSDAGARRRAIIFDRTPLEEAIAASAGGA